MTTLITLNIPVGGDAGPFNLYSNTDGYTIPFATNISAAALTAGYTSTVVLNGTTVIRVVSTGVCTNYIDIPVNLITTTTTSSSTSTSTTTSTTTVPPTSTTTSTSSSTTTSTTTIPPTSTTTSSSSTSTSSSTTTVAPTTTTTTTVEPTTTSTTTVCLDCVAHDVTIGSQIWTGCNLNVSTFRNGVPIPQITDATTWGMATGPAWCYYDFNPANEAAYGKLYNIFAITSTANGTIAPTGYHIPSNAEWTTLTATLGGGTWIDPYGSSDGNYQLLIGDDLKEVGTCHWTIGSGYDTVGFTALPGGGAAASGYFVGLGNSASFGSNTLATGSMNYWQYELGFTNAIYRNWATITVGISVRLVKDTTPTTTTSSGLCRFVQVDNTVDINRYGVQYFPPNGLPINVLFVNMFGTPSGSDTIYGYCSITSGGTWDSDTDNIVVLPGVTNLPPGGVCYSAEDACIY